jgi:hypothetical protein
MNYLVFLDAQAGELEKILSGTKSMLVKEFDPARTTDQPVNPGDSLYLLRNKEEYALRVKATVVRAQFIPNDMHDNLSHILKEVQPRLQLTEEQYNYWSAKQKVLLVEFNSAHKIDLIQVASKKVADRSNWIAFEKFCSITE